MVSYSYHTIHYIFKNRMLAERFYYSNPKSKMLYWVHDGIDEYWVVSTSELTPQLKLPVGCIDVKALIGAELLEGEAYVIIKRR